MSIRLLSMSRSSGMTPPFIGLVGRVMLLIVLASLLLGERQVRAERRSRDGFVGSFDLGIGVMGAEHFDEGSAHRVSTAVGWFLGRNFSVVLGVSGIDRSVEGALNSSLWSAGVLVPVADSFELMTQVGRHYLSFDEALVSAGIGGALTGALRLGEPDSDRRLAGRLIAAIDGSLATSGPFLYNTWSISIGVGVGWR